MEPTCQVRSGQDRVAGVQVVLYALEFGHGAHQLYTVFSLSGYFGACLDTQTKRLVEWLLVIVLTT